MGRHRGAPEGREDQISGAPGSRVGSGRRRRGPGSGAGQDAAAGGPGAAPPPRSEQGPHQHPEHAEHGAWGAVADWAASPGSVRSPGGRPGTEPSALDDPAEQDAARGLGPLRGARPGTAIPGQRSGPVPLGRPGGGPGALRVPGQQTTERAAGPRKDFLDAFDTRPAGPEDDDGTQSGSVQDSSAGEPVPKGRPFAGFAAAAVVTVLAVVVAGQVTEAGRDREAVRASASGAASRSHPRAASPGGSPSPSASVPAAPLSYAQAMAQVYPLDRQLALSGAFTTVGGYQRAPGKGRVLRVRVDVEKGLPLDGGMFAQAVYRTLNDTRSWGHGGIMTFERVPSGHADIVVTLASPGTTAKWCAKSGLDTRAENVSCDSASTPRTMINAYRWAQGAETYGPDKIFLYREMVINHEVGHRLGHGHVGCPRNGVPAPVMMQQTKFLTMNGLTCEPNPWPFPTDG